MGIGEPLSFDRPYKSKVVLCWEGGSKSAGGGVMKGGPLKEVLVMGSDARREERPGAGKQYCDEKHLKKVGTSLLYIVTKF